jgi:hypothetical protein
MGRSVVTPSAPTKLAEGAEADKLLDLWVNKFVQGLKNHISAVLVWLATTFQPLSNFCRFMVVLPTTVC